jgi:ATP-dependent Lon protease
MGLQVVNDTLANNYIRPDESMKAQAMVKDRAAHLHRQGEGAPRRLGLLGRGHNFGNKFRAHPEHYVRDYERL